MPRAAGSLLEALSRTHVGEDQLTELLAFVLEHDKDVTRELLAPLGLPSEVVRATTQRRLPEMTSPRRVDLEILLGRAPACHVLWIEVKAGATEQIDQLKDYGEELERLHPGQSTLVALAPIGDRVFTSAALTGSHGRVIATALHWQAVADAVHRAGATTGGLAWVKAAYDVDGPAAQRVRAEIFEHLQRHPELAIMPDEPLLAHDKNIARAERLLGPNGLIAGILYRASQVLVEPGAAMPPWRSPAGAGYYQGCSLSSPTPPAWLYATPLSRDSPGMELWFMPDDAHDEPDTPRNEPAFAASLVMNGPGERLRTAVRTGAWKLPPDALPFAQGDRGRVSFLLYLADLAAASNTLTGQAEYLADWARPKFMQLSEIPPPA